MSNLMLAPFEPDFRDITHDVARFEALCAGKRELESKIENSIWEIDRVAASELKSAEEELQEINLECATIRARITRAAGERFERSEEIPSTNDTDRLPSLMKGVNPAIPYPRRNAILGDNISISGPILSPVSASSDLGSFTVISNIDAEISPVLPLTDDTRVLTPTNVLDSPTNDSDHLVSLLQRYYSLCRTIGTLRDGINEQAETMNESALAKVEHAKLRLEMSRGKAREIVEGMKKTSEGRVNVRFPWVLLEDGIRKRLSVVTPPPFPTLRTTSNLDNVFNDENSSSGLKKRDSRGPLTPPPTSHPHSPTFEKYDAMMNIVRSRLAGDLWPWDIPWPVLPRSIHKFPVKSSNYLLARDAVGNSVKQFIESYAGWKAHPIHRVRATMITDWRSIVDKTPVWRAGQKEMTRLIVHHLSDSE